MYTRMVGRKQQVRMAGSYELVIVGGEKRRKVVWADFHYGLIRTCVGG